MANWFTKKKVLSEGDPQAFSRNIVPWTTGAMAEVYDTVRDTTPAYTPFGATTSRVTGRLQIEGPTQTQFPSVLHTSIAGFEAGDIFLQGLTNVSPNIYNRDTGPISESGE